MSFCDNGKRKRLPGEGRGEAVLGGSGKEGLQESFRLGGAASGFGPDVQPVQKTVLLTGQAQHAGKFSQLLVDGTDQGAFQHQRLCQIHPAVGIQLLSLDIELHAVDAVQLAERVDDAQYRKLRGLFVVRRDCAKVAVAVHLAEPVLHQRLRKAGAGRQGRAHAAALRSADQSLQYLHDQILLVCTGEGPFFSQQKTFRFVRVVEGDFIVGGGTVVVEQDIALREKNAVQQSAALGPNVDLDLVDPIQRQTGFCQAGVGQGVVEFRGGVGAAGQPQLQRAAVTAGAGQYGTLGDGADEIPGHRPLQIKLEQLQIRIAFGTQIPDLGPDHAILGGEVRFGGAVEKAYGLDHGGVLAWDAAGGEQQAREQEQEADFFHCSSSSGVG